MATHRVESRGVKHDPSDDLIPGMTTNEKMKQIAS